MNVGSNMDEEQELDNLRNILIEKAISGHNLAIIGAAGTGKTTLVGKIIESINHQVKKYVVSATTGAAM